MRASVAFLDTVTKEFLAIGFNRKQDVRSNYVEQATAAALEQYKSLLTGLQAVDLVKTSTHSAHWQVTHSSGCTCVRGGEAREASNHVHGTWVVVIHRSVVHGRGE